MYKSAQKGIRAVLMGVLVDIGGSMLFTGIIVFFLTFILTSQGVPQTEIDKRLLQSTAFLGGSLVIGFVFTFLAGFVAARIAVTRAIMYSSTVGVISVILGLVFLFVSGPDTLPLWYYLVGLVFTIPIAALGGYIAKRTRKQTSV